MKDKFSNKRKLRFIESRPDSGIETSDIALRCKFNFSYFCAGQVAGQEFAEWGQSIGASSLVNLMDKLANFTNESLAYWRNERVGGGGLKVLAYYDHFPKKSDFTHPSHVPHDVVWARFRIASKVRLIGFVIPEELADKEFKDRNGKYYRYDSNTFYVVFLDKNHRFYQAEKA